jgi:hypothetical protein
VTAAREKPDSRSFSRSAPVMGRPAALLLKLLAAVL